MILLDYHFPCLYWFAISISCFVVSLNNQFLSKKVAYCSGSHSSSSLTWAPLANAELVQVYEESLSLCLCCCSLVVLIITVLFVVTLIIIGGFVAALLIVSLLGGCWRISCLCCCQMHMFLCFLLGSLCCGGNHWIGHGCRNSVIITVCSTDAATATGVVAAATTCILNGLGSLVIVITVPSPVIAATTGAVTVLWHRAS